MSKNEKKPLGPNSVDMGERGTYDKRNKLNDLTGKEWVYFTNSVWITGYSPTARENVGLKTRKKSCTMIRLQNLIRIRELI